MSKIIKLKDSKPIYFVPRYNFFLDETSSELNPMINFVDKNKEYKRYYDVVKTNYQIISKNKLYGGSLAIDTIKKVIRFIKHYPHYDTPDNKIFSSNDQLTTSLNTKWSNYIEITSEINIINDFNVDYTFDCTLDCTLLNLPYKMNDEYYFYLRGKLLKELIKLNNLSLKEWNIKNDEKHYQLVKNTELNNTSESNKSNEIVNTYDNIEDELCYLCFI
jgi:hypothetical protein